MKRFLFALILVSSIYTVFAQSCPTVNVSCPNEVSIGNEVSFSANVSGGDPQVTPTYNWTISNGTIALGQGTSTITISTKDLTGTITATVDVGGYSRECATSNSCTVSLTAAAATDNSNPFDNATVTYSSLSFAPSDMKWEIASFIRSNSWNTFVPARYALVYVYPAKTWKATQLKKVRGQLQTALVQNKVQKGGYKIVTASAQEKAEYTITLVSKGDEEPKPKQ